MAVHCEAVPDRRLSDRVMSCAWRCDSPRGLCLSNGCQVAAEGRPDRRSYIRHIGLCTTAADARLPVPPACTLRAACPERLRARKLKIKIRRSTGFMSAGCAAFNRKLPPPLPVGDERGAALSSLPRSAAWKWLKRVLRFYRRSYPAKCGESRAGDQRHCTPFFRCYGKLVEAEGEQLPGGVPGRVPGEYLFRPTGRLPGNGAGAAEKRLPDFSFPSCRPAAFALHAFKPGGRRASWPGGTSTRCWMAIMIRTIITNAGGCGSHAKGIRRASWSTDPAYSEQ